MNCEAEASHSWGFTTSHSAFPECRINSTHCYFTVWLCFGGPFLFFFGFFFRENHRSKCSAASKLFCRYCLSTQHVHLGPPGCWRISAQCQTHWIGKAPALFLLSWPLHLHPSHTAHHPGPCCPQLPQPHPFGCSAPAPRCSTELEASSPCQPLCVV